MICELKLHLNAERDFIGFDYRNKLHGAMCRLFGDNNYRQVGKKYCYSPLLGVKETKNGIDVSGEPYIIVRISDKDKTPIVNFLNEVTNNNKLFYGLSVAGYSIKEGTKQDNVFKSPIFSPMIISKSIKNKGFLNDNEIKKAEKYIYNNLESKLNECGISAPSFKVKILKQNATRGYHYNNRFNVGYCFNTIIDTTDEIKEFILMNGLGKSTGEGFGFVY